MSFDNPILTYKKFFSIKMSVFLDNVIITMLRCICRKKQNQKNNQLNFKSDNYKINDSYKTDDLVVANLEYIYQVKQRHMVLWLSKQNKNIYLKC